MHITNMDEILERVYNKETNFTESELRELAGEYAYKQLFEEPRRWVRTVESILAINDKYFSITWEQGLTESQESEFDNQPVEVTVSKEMVETTYYTPITNK